MIRRRGIFIKMFIWFWLVMTVVIAIIIALDRLTESDGRETPLHDAVGAPLTHYGHVAVEQAESGDREGLGRTMEAMRTVAGMNAFLFDGALRELRGAAPPGEVVEYAERALKRGKAVFAFSHARILGAMVLEGREGRHYVIVGMVPGRAPGSSWGGALFLLPRLGIALVISCLACYLLARYLTVPIIRLGSSARQLASGDLTARINPASGNRWDEIGELARDFNLMAERIQLLLSSERRLLGNISHELRSPLARLNVALELARRHSTPEAEKSLDRIEWEAERLNDLIGQLLTLTRLESSLENAKREAFGLADMIREVADDADFEAQSLNRAVGFTEDGDCEVTGVRQLLRSAVENVVRNAVWYTGEGTEVEINLRCTAEKGSQLALVTVRDHGPGVPEEALPHLFRPFYRVDGALERQPGGAGLGLAITERAVLLHGGTVRAWNAMDGGLVIEIAIPAKG